MTLFTGRIGRAALAALVLTCAFPARDLHAQNASAPFIVAVPDVYPGQEGSGFIIRRAGEKDLIVLDRAQLNAPALTSAIALLRRLRKGPAVPTDASEITTVQGFAPFRGGTPRAVPGVERALATLRAAPRTRIGNVGQGRWIELSTDVLR